VEEAEARVALGPGAGWEDGMLQAAALLRPLPAFLGPLSGRSANFCGSELSGFSLGPVKSGLRVQAHALRLFGWFRTSQG